MAEKDKMKQMARVLRVLSVAGLCLLVWLLCRPAAHREAPVGSGDPGAPVVLTPEPVGPVTAAELPPALPASSSVEPNTSRSQVFLAVPALPDRAASKPPRGAHSESYTRLEILIKKYAALHGVDEDLVWAVMRHESGFDPGAVSPQGAMGLMQLMPGTAALLGVKDPFNVEQNIQGGIRYLEMCLARFDQDVGLAVAAYNAGPENVAKYQGCPPFPETINYVNVVLRDYGAGVLHRGLKIGSRKIVVAEEEAAPAVPTGLLWKVPIPHWKVPEPQVKVSPPIWRVPRTLVISSAK